MPTFVSDVKLAVRSSELQKSELPVTNSAQITAVPHSWEGIPATAE